MFPPRFGIKLINEDHITKQFAIIERLMQQADGIVNCGDAGQEGELIQRWVMQKAQANPIPILPRTETEGSISSTTAKGTTVFI